MCKCESDWSHQVEELKKQLAIEKMRNAAYETETWIEVENILADATTDEDCLDGCSLQEIAQCVVDKVFRLEQQLKEK